MKGITQLLRELKEPLVVTDMERSDIHKLAKRAGVKVKIQRITGGFLVSPVEEVKESVDKDFDFGA